VQDANNTVGLMRFLASNGPALQAIAKAADAISAAGSGLVFAIELSSWLGTSWSGVLDWFGEHGDHNIVARDEYGREDGQCAENTRCGACGVRHVCKLSQGHAGEHSAREVSGG
jgi:hypothetical protein